MTMMVSMALAGAASQKVSPQIIGAVAGCLSASTAFFWGWANWKGKLPEPISAEESESEPVEFSHEPAG